MLKKKKTKLFYKNEEEILSLEKQALWEFMASGHNLQDIERYLFRQEECIRQKLGSLSVHKKIKRTKN